MQTSLRSHLLAAAPCSAQARPARQQQPFRAPAVKRARHMHSTRQLRSRVEVTVTNAVSSEAQADNFIPVIRPEELPKGTRKEVRVEGKGVLLFWYRNQIYAIESRSPAEGAYSEGFMDAKFTQDYCIECPSTGSLFSLRDGSIVSWYPGNPVLRALTPQDTCRNLEIYPVRLTQDAIEVDVSGSLVGSRVTRGGANTSLENNNVYGLEPKTYVDGADGSVGTANSATVLVATVTVGLLAVVGTGAAIYFFAFSPLQ